MSQTGRVEEKLFQNPRLFVDTQSVEKKPVRTVSGPKLLLILSYGVIAGCSIQHPTLSPVAARTDQYVHLVLRRYLCQRSIVSLGGE